MRACLLFASAMLAGCASGPPAPAWQADAKDALAGFTQAYFGGNARMADLEFARARAGIASTGRVDLAARAELARCAARVASLEFDDCPGYLALAQDAGAPERAYAAFLAGRWEGIDAASLPPQYRSLVAGGDAAGALAAIEDPMSRQVAAGVLMRLARATPAAIAAATENASANGWRRPLLAWLSVQEQRAQSAGDRDAAARIRRRIALAEGIAP